MREEGFLDEVFDWWINKKYHFKIYDNTIKEIESIDWWDYQWEFARFINSGLTIVPRINLVQNIGFGDHATHTFSNVFKAPSRASELEFPIIHPPAVLQDIKSDRQYLREFFKFKLISFIRRKISF